MSCDEAAHHLDTFRVVKHLDCDSGLRKQVFSPKKIAIFADDDRRDAEQQRCSCTHNAWAERADQSELRPISPPSCIADTDDFRVCGGIATLNAQIVAARDHASSAIGKDRTDGQSAFT